MKEGGSSLAPLGLGVKLGSNWVADRMFWEDQKYGGRRGRRA